MLVFKIIIFSVNISVQYGEKRATLLAENPRNKFVAWRDSTGVIVLSGGTVQGIGLRSRPFCAQLCVCMTRSD